MAGATAHCWTLRRGDPGYPALRSPPDQQPTLYGIGDSEILNQPILGLICSVKCPGSVVLQTFDAIRELRDAGMVVAGGFHSSMERECLEFLLRGRQPVILCPARHPSLNRIPQTWQDALETQRLLIVSPFGDRVRRSTASNAQLRNEFVTTLAAAVLIPYASPGGKAEAAALSPAGLATPVLTIEDSENRRLLAQGASPFSINAVFDLLNARSRRPPRVRLQQPTEARRADDVARPDGR